ncbi:MAG: AAA family ATPase [Anaerolineales bacterium]
MQNILLIVGSPASGKSTISHAIAEQSKKGVHIPVDDLRTMVQGGVLHPGPNWPPELIHQLSLARQTAIDMALRYQEADFLVAIDDFWDSFSQLQEYRSLINQPNVFPILLKPALSVVLTRNHARKPPSEFRDHMDDGIRMIYEDLDKQETALRHQGWKIVDTSTDTIEESIAQVFKLLETSTG